MENRKIRNIKFPQGGENLSHTGMKWDKLIYFFFVFILVYNKTLQQSLIPLGKTSYMDNTRHTAC